MRGSNICDFRWDEEKKKKGEGADAGSNKMLAARSTGKGTSGENGPYERKKKKKENPGAREGKTSTGGRRPGPKKGWGTGLKPSQKKNKETEELPG